MDTNMEHGESTMRKMEHGESTMRQQVKEAAHELQACASSVTQHTRAAASKLSAALGDARTRVQDSTIARARAANQAIHDYPYASLGIAFGVGLVLGLTVMRRA